jgi:hypothetical protein
MPRTPDAKVIINSYGNVAAEGAALQVFGEAACEALESLADPSPWDLTPDTLHCTQEEFISWGLRLCDLGHKVREMRVALQGEMSDWFVQRAADVKAGKWPPAGTTAQNAPNTVPTS